jgi:hypothetical protein
MSSNSDIELTQAVRAKLLHWKMLGALYPKVDPLRDALATRLMESGFTSLDRVEDLDWDTDMPFAQSKLVTSVTQRFLHPDSEVPFLMAVSLTLPFDRSNLGRCFLQVILVDITSGEANLDSVRATGSADASADEGEQLGVLGKVAYIKRIHLAAPQSFESAAHWQNHITTALLEPLSDRVVSLAEDALAHLERCTSA